MMKRHLTILAVSTVALSACIPGLTKKTDAPAAPQEQSAASKITEFAQLGAALATGKSVRCTITQDGSPTITQYMIKQKKMKMLANDPSKPDSAMAMITDGEVLYTWDTVKKVGTKFLIPKETTAQPTNQPEVPDFSNPTEQEKLAAEGFKINCDVASLDDSEFVPPSDVQFTDMSALLENAQKMAPAAGQVPSAADRAAMEQQVQEMMKQYGGQE